MIQADLLKQQKFEEASLTRDFCTNAEKIIKDHLRVYYPTLELGDGEEWKKRLECLLNM